MKVVADNKIPYLKGVLEPFAEVVYLPGAKIDADVVKDADALIVRTRTQCNKSLLEGSKVRFIATATIGYDHIDTKWCEQNGIVWKNAEGCNSLSVMQYIASTLAWLGKSKGINFEDRTIGVVGVGNVGKKVVKVAESFGMRVVLCDPPLARQKGQCGFISLDGILREADIITLHVPLTNEGTDKTFHLFDKKNLEKIINGSILINSSRGEVIDNQALKEVVRQKHLQACVLDVWENEPNPDGELLSLLDITTPHIAGYSADGKAAGTSMSVNALANFFRLPLKDWKPDSIPVQSNPNITINCENKTAQDVLIEAILATHDIVADSNALRNNPADFEKHRENYPLRREFHAYHLHLENGNADITERLRRLGFKMA